jgi:hypothetical protein
MIRRQVAAPSSSPGGCELVGARDAFLERLIAVALEHELRCPPNVDIGYHAAKAARLPSIKV